MGEIYIQQLAHLEMVGGWVKGTDLIFHTVGGYRKYGFLRWWGVAVMDDGYLSITELGQDFLKNKACIPRTIVLFNNTLVGTSDNDLVYISDCLEEFFDFNKLMDPSNVRHITTGRGY